MNRRLALLLVPLLLSASLTAGAPVQPVKPQPSKPAAPSPEEMRKQLMLRINEERNKAGVAPMAPSQPLGKIAQKRADEIAAKGALPQEKESFALFNRVQIDMVKAGYKAHGWTESITVTAGTADDVIAYWKEDASYRQAMGKDYQDMGIGFASFNGVPLYTFLFAWPRTEFYSRQTSDLKDAAMVRAAMLARVNAERRAQGLEPLVADPRLDAAAQKHAEDMLSRIYYAHITPEGTMPRQRVQSNGFLADIVGENIAAGHFTVDSAMDAWLLSSGHRRNILEPRFTHLGVGIAVGDYEHRYQVLWVQDFARPE